MQSKTPNQPAATNPAMMSRCDADRRLRRFVDRDRWSGIGRLSMKTSPKFVTISLFLLGSCLLSGCCTVSHARKDPSFPASPGHRYTVYVGDKQFLVDSVRFEGDWAVLEGGYPALKALWIPREQVSVIQEPK